MRVINRPGVEVVAVVLGMAMVKCAIWLIVLGFLPEMVMAQNSPATKQWYVYDHVNQKCVDAPMTPKAYANQGLQVGETPFVFPLYYNDGTENSIQVTVANIEYRFYPSVADCQNAVNAYNDALDGQPDSWGTELGSETP